MCTHVHYWYICNLLFKTLLSYTSDNMILNTFVQLRGTCNYMKRKTLDGATRRGVWFNVQVKSHGLLIVLI